MNDTEAIAHLRARTKPYMGIMLQGSFSNAIIRYEAGLSKPRTFEKFMNKFGYVKENGVWRYTA